MGFETLDPLFNDMGKEKKRPKMYNMCVIIDIQWR